MKAHLNKVFGLGFACEKSTEALDENPVFTRQILSFKVYLGSLLITGCLPLNYFTFNNNEVY